jgi:RNA polymerase sigma factor (sigma-70 family)
MEAAGRHRTPGLRRPYRLLGDETLARQAAAGDPDAFAAIFTRYRDPLYRHCAWMLRHPQDAEEALQGTMLSAYRALLGGKAGAVALRPWLYRIAHNECLQILRRRPGTESDEVLAFVADPVAEGRAETREAMRELDADLMALPTAQRSALLLRELGGLSHDGIAHALDASPQAVKQLIYEARQALLEFRAGRALACAEVRRLISDQDGRILRGRRTQAHLRSCAGCRQFRAALADRPRQLLGLAPVLPLLAGERILAAVLGSGGGPGGGSAAAAAASASGGLTRIVPVAVGGGAATLIGLTLLLGGHEAAPRPDRVPARPAADASVRPPDHAAAATAAVRRPRPTAHPKAAARHVAPVRARASSPPPAPARTVVAAPGGPGPSGRTRIEPGPSRPGAAPPTATTPSARAPAPRVAVAPPRPAPAPASAPAPAPTTPTATTPTAAAAGAPPPASPAGADPLRPSLPPAFATAPPPTTPAPAQPPPATTDPETRPGNGLGDPNHDHTGPPGQGGADRPGNGNGDPSHDHTGPPGAGAPAQP